MDVEWLTILGEIWYLKDIAKDYGGKWDARCKEWDSISVDALPKLVQKAYEYGYPLSGNFNYDGRMTPLLGPQGAYLDVEKETYKWSLHTISTGANN